MELEKKTKAEMEEALLHFQKELKNLRSSRANPHVLDSVVVEVYGAQMRLRDLANITLPEPRQLLITPFDRNNTKAIGKAIEHANLNLLPIVEGNQVRINIPPMDQKAREEVVKQCKKKAEEAKIAIREVRRRQNADLKDKKENHPEDIIKSMEKKIQDLTNKYCEKIEILSAEKQQDILQI